MNIQMLTPYRQGGLDYLCGIYSVINATRNCLYPDIKLNSTESRELFEHLLDYLDENSLLYSVNLEGTNIPTLGRYLKTIDEYLKDYYDVGLIYKKPFHRRKEVETGIALELIKELLGKNNSSVILSTEEHWSVIARITDKTVFFADSSGIKLTRIKNVSFDKQPDKLYNFIPNSLFLVEAEKM